MIRSALLALATLLAAAAAAAPAPAATVVGPDPSASRDAGAGCPTPSTSCTYSQNQLGGQPMRVPADGVVTSWRLRTGAIGSVVTLRVMRPEEGSTVRFVSSSAPVSYEDGTDEVIGPLATRQPVRAGDRLGFRFAAPPGGWASQASIAPLHIAGGDTFQTWRAPDPADGESAAPKSFNSGYQLLVQAVVEPDADGDGYGDETQDACPELAGRQACVADLAVAVSGPASVVRGAPARLRAAVANAGPDASEPVTLAVTLPDGLRLDSAPAGCAPPEGGRVACALDAVAAGEERAVELAVTPLASGQLPVAASATAASRDASGAAGSFVVNAVEPPVVIVEPPRDAAPPVVSGLRVRRGARRRLTAAFTVTEAGRMALTIQRLVPGRRAGRRCVRGRRTGRRCSRSVRVGTTSFDVRAGTATRRLRRLRPGRYRLIALARDGAGNRSVPVTKVFVVPRRR